MNGFYVTSNIDPLNKIANGRVLKVVNAILDARNESRENKATLVAYRIHDFDWPICTIECLIENKWGFHFRNFSYYKETGTIDDCIQTTANYGFGFHVVELERFFELRDFYLQNKEVPANT